MEDEEKELPLESEQENSNSNEEYDESEYEEFYEFELEDKAERMRRKAAKQTAQGGNKRKGHQSKHGSREDRWDSIENEYADAATFQQDRRPPMPNNRQRLLGNAQECATREHRPSNQAGPKTQYDNRQPQAKDAQQGKPQSNFTFGPNSHEVKGNMIDFDRVTDIQKVESVHNGRNTYGIKFLFVSKKGLYRIAWFNQNQKDRDIVYNKELTYWMGLDSFLTRSKRIL